ncbi:MAG: hypothetical protein RTV31_16950 [Candidatus Thorarchaeota archaeon]
MQVTTQTIQQMFSITGFGLLGPGFIIVILFFVIGLREKDDILRKIRFYRIAGILLGLMIIISGITVFVHRVATSPMPMTIEEVIILTSISSIGGLISGISCYYDFGQ